MTTTMSVRELTQNSALLNGYDYIDIEDRNSHEYKGVFVSARLADEVKQYLAKKLQKQKQEERDALMQFAGSMEIEERFRDKSAQEIRAMIAKEKYGE